MIQIEYRPVHQDRIKALITEIGRVDDRFLASVQETLIEGNRRDRLEGVDRTGRPLIPWKVRRGKYAGRKGPTLAPFGRNSRSVTTFYADRRGTTITAGFRGNRVEILAYHAAGKAGTGRKGQVTGIVRDIMGVSPRTINAIRSEWKYTIRAIGARGVRAVSGVARRAASFFGSF